MSQKKRKNISQRPHTRKIALPLLCWALLALVPCGASPVHAGEVINYTGGRWQPPREQAKQTACFRPAPFPATALLSGLLFPAMFTAGSPSLPGAKSPVIP